jgi:signal transduction histidine kinase
LGKRGQEAPAPRRLAHAAPSSATTCPQILDQTVDTLAACHSSPLNELVEMTRSHGTMRFHQQFNVQELIVEYRVLRRILVEEINRGLGGKLKVGQVIVLNMGIDTALQHGVMAFINHQREQTPRRRRGPEPLPLLPLARPAQQPQRLHADARGAAPAARGLAGFTDDVADIASVQRSVSETIAGMDRILQAERLRREAIQPKVLPVDLHALVHDVARHASRLAEHKGIRLRLEIPANATVESDRELITLVLQNLIGNAVKYSNQGTVTVSARPRQDPVRDGWEIVVADEGPGIAAHHRERMFQAFARGETHGQPGVGLGLAIAKPGDAPAGRQNHVRIGARTGARPSDSQSPGCARTQTGR